MLANCRHRSYTRLRSPPMDLLMTATTAHIAEKTAEIQPPPARKIELWTAVWAPETSEPVRRQPHRTTTLQSSRHATRAARAPRRHQPSALVELHRATHTRTSARPPDICEVFSLRLERQLQHRLAWRASRRRRRPTAGTWTGKQSPSSPGSSCAPTPPCPSPR